MHPAPSIILFTTMSGLGYGLAAMLGLGLLDADALATKFAHVLALCLIGGGLLASTLHLGNPQRAWRAFSQWRSSWLSREGVLSVLGFVPLTFTAFACVWYGRMLPISGLIGAAFCVATVYCTAMIYASLRSVQAWNTPRTPLCYLLFALAGGLVLANLFATLGAGSVGLACALALPALIAAWAAKLAGWRDLAAQTPLSTPESATGLGFIGQVRLFERPHVNPNYLTSEMGFRVGRKHAAKLRVLALILGGFAPSLILLLLAMPFGPAGWFAVFLASIATLCFVAGILAERWLFFAEARHAVMNYYG